MITLGLTEILVGVASTSGVMPATMTKIGMTYQDTCKIPQEKAEVTEHFEEGKSSPAARLKKKKMPKPTFSIMDPSVQTLIDYVGGANIGTEGAPKWGFDGTEDVVNRAIRFKTDQGLWVDIPNADIEAVINADLSKKGLFLVEFEITPMAVDSGKPIHSYMGVELTVAPTSLTFTSSADSTGQTITASSSGNVTSASKPSADEWLTVTRALKVVTVKVSANTNSEARTAYVTIVADGITAVVPVTQAGA